MRDAGDAFLGDDAAEANDANMRDPDQGLDAGHAPDATPLAGCQGDASCERFVFVTSGEWKGTGLGGLAGAEPEMCGCCMPPTAS